MACKGYERREARRKEIERFHAVLYNNVHCSQKLTQKDFYPLVTDGEVRLMTKDEYEEANKLFDNVIWQTTN